MKLVEKVLCNAAVFAVWLLFSYAAIFFVWPVIREDDGEKRFDVSSVELRVINVQEIAGGSATRMAVYYVSPNAVVSVLRAHGIECEREMFDDRPSDNYILIDGEAPFLSMVITPKGKIIVEENPRADDIMNAMLNSIGNDIEHYYEE